MEYLTLAQCRDKLCNGLSQDPLTVCNKLFTKKLVSEAQVRDCQLQSKNDYWKASLLVDTASQKIEAFPNNFETFLDILQEFPHLQDVVEHMRKQYKTNKAMALNQQEITGK